MVSSAIPGAIQGVPQSPFRRCSGALWRHCSDVFQAAFSFRSMTPFSASCRGSEGAVLVPLRYHFRCRLQRCSKCASGAVQVPFLGLQVTVVGAISGERDAIMASFPDSGAVADAVRRHVDVVSGVQKGAIFKRCRHYFQTPFKRHSLVRSANLSVIAGVPDAIQASFWHRGWGCFPATQLQRYSGVASSFGNGKSSFW